jgi:hypothetical protein
MANTTQALPAGAISLPADPKHPDGNWAVLLDFETLDFGAVLDILGSIKGGEGYGKASNDLRTALVAALVTNWSFDLPLPADDATLRRLPSPAGLALFRAVEPAFKMINGSGTKPVLTKETLADEGSPTGGSSA